MITKLVNLFKNNILVQIRIIKALVFREIITRYGRKNLGFLWLFIEPLIFTIGVSALWFLVKGIVSDQITPFAFALTGYSTVLLWRNSANRCVLAVEPNQALMYHRNVNLIDVFLARLVLEIIGVTISFILLFVIFLFFNQIGIPDDLLKILIAWFLLIWFAIVLGIFVGCLSELLTFFDKIWHPLTYILFPLSGALFFVSWLPTSLQEIILYIPVVHMVELLREGFFGTVINDFKYDYGYFLIFTVALSLLSMILNNYLRRRLTIE
jgi:capsular polysaccharide transport system permease protein